MNTADKSASRQDQLPPPRGKTSRADLPPHSDIDEKAILGCILLAPDCLPEAQKSGITARSFHVVNNRVIFLAFEAMLRAGVGIDLATVPSWLAANKQLSDADGASYVATLPDATPSAANLQYHIGVVLEAHQKREFLQFCAEGPRIIATGADWPMVAEDLRIRFDSITSNGTDTDAPPMARPLSALARPARDDASELLRHRFLCRGGGLLLCGPTGIGKSALAMQAAILWAVGRTCFGIEPTRAMKSLFVQAENDDGDMAEMRDGVMAGLQLTEAEAKAACENVLVCREDEVCGAAFFGRARLLLAEHKPDLLWIDPALAYIGGESNNQKDVGEFLRNRLNPLLREFRCAVVIIHHTNKPSTGREKATWQAGDFAYLGAGSAEWANWARAVLALRSNGSHDVFELHAAKRGARLNWHDSDETKTYVKHIAHAKEPGVICWHEAGTDEIPSKGGAPKKCDVEELLDLLPPEGLKTGDWQRLAKEECGISERSFFRERKVLANDKRIHKSKITDKWQPITNA